MKRCTTLIDRHTDNDSVTSVYTAPVLRLVLANWIVIESAATVLVSPLTAVALARRDDSQSRRVGWFCAGVIATVSVTSAVAAVALTRDAWIYIAESQAVVASAAFAAGAIGAYCAVLFVDVLDAAAISLAIVIVFAGTVFAAGPAIADLPTSALNAALLTNPIVSAAAAANVDLFRSAFLYDHSPIAHGLFAYPVWYAASGVYLLVTAVMLIATSRFSGRHPGLPERPRTPSRR